jgi:hypothetical protein
MIVRPGAGSYANIDFMIVSRVWFEAGARRPLESIGERKFDYNEI